MTFLPIVDRELRVAARRGITYWSRVVAAVLAIMVAFGFLLILEVSKNAMGFAPGSSLFAILKWMSFPCVCLAGVFLTSDCLSEEKRDGTLGLLFLTDLRGYDVVFGKLLANSLRAVYGLLAIFPVMALTLLMGGVSGGEFWRMMLILCNTLFFSLSAGVLISSLSREAIKAMNGALLVSLLFVSGLPFLDCALAGWDTSKFEPIFSLASPGYCFVTAGPSLPKTFWLNLAIPHAIGWLFLGASSLCAPRAWQEKATRSDERKNSLSHRWRYGTEKGRAVFRLKLLARNPALWLTSRDRWLARVIWVVLLATAVVLVLMYEHSSFKRTLAFTGQGIYYLLALTLLLWVCTQASRFFVEARRNGALELMLVTPLTVREIVGAQVRTLCRVFLVPALVVLCLKVGFGVMQIGEMRKAFGGVSTATAATTNMTMVTTTYTIGGAKTTITNTTTTTVTTNAPSAATTITVPPTVNFDYEIYQIVGLITSGINFPADLIALACFGMWMGLTTKKTNLAVIKTLVFVLVLPWLALMFVQGMLMALGTFTMMGRAGGMSGGIFRFFWIPTLIVCALNLGKDVVFSVWSWRKLHSDFRAEVSQTRGLVFRQPPLPVPPPVNVPPVIAA
jgi:ABC-type transport system involved in cytochrome c biogenesis permease component